MSIDGVAASISAEPSGWAISGWAGAVSVGTGVDSGLTTGAVGDVE